MNTKSGREWAKKGPAGMHPIFLRGDKRTVSGKGWSRSPGDTQTPINRGATFTSLPKKKGEISLCLTRRKAIRALLLDKLPTARGAFGAREKGGYAFGKKQSEALVMKSECPEGAGEGVGRGRAGLQDTNRRPQLGGLAEERNVHKTANHLRS